MIGSRWIRGALEPQHAMTTTTRMIGWLAFCLNLAVAGFFPLSNAFSATPTSLEGVPEVSEKDQIIAKFGDIVLPQTASDPTTVTGRTERIRQLIAVVQNDQLAKTNRLAVHKAMLLLGRMKAIEAAPFIVERLDLAIIPNLGEFMRVSEPPSRDVLYPAVQALADIGKPVLPVLADALGCKKRSEGFRDLVLCTMGMIAPGSEKTREYLRQRRELYERGVKELDAALERMKGAY